jgi:hypothetical protein
MAKLNELLKRKHPELWQNLEDKQMDPQFYSFRWLTLLLSQEFELPDIFRLWDSFFADPNRFEFMSYFCCAMLVYAPLFTPHTHTFLFRFSLLFSSHGTRPSVTQCRCG